MDRRTFIKQGVSLLGLLFLGDGDPVDHADSQSALEDLAKIIDATDLTDPEETFTLPNEFPERLKRAEDGLTSQTTKNDRQIASLKHSVRGMLSVIPGVASPPTQPKIEREIDAIEAAITYYETVESLFNRGADLHIDLNDVEIAIADDSDLPNLVADEDLDELHSQLSSIEETTTTLNTDNKLLVRLLPDVESVVTDAQTLTSFYEAYAELQRKYIEASERISEGALYWENREADTAKEHFNAAVARTETSIPEEIRRPPLNDGALSPATYSNILEKYHSGAAKMSDACDGLEDEPPVTKFGNGLDQIITAREAFGNRE
ncbi:hypothetical protein U4E84_09310 [Halorubrum sp. AD140]|uniref:hypothetical protein n=1 Tax=Halorubrum sp. AD140 TaxID=3050073 RepID=UPI002ACCFA6C|nr:hypothetical protein [Halorubrum sp. AD140]MDZ5811541.1 hypothetical protein [Halorubrum sp. AD140]